MFSGQQHPLAPAAAATRRLLGDLREVLAAAGPATEPRLATLRQTLADLDYLFLLVVAGEFNAGKSALINTLLGAEVLAEGVTPTTVAVTLLTYGAQPERVERSDGLLEQRFPLPLLRDVALIDTPGTNAVLREHERLTREFVPRSDLLLFVTSADRPFTESERGFLEQVRAWGKKIIFVLNKIDLLANPAELAAQVQFIRANAQRLLGLDPPIWPVSVRQVRAGQDQAGRFAALRAHLERVLTDRERVRLKLASALGVAARLLADQQASVSARQATLSQDREARAAIERRLVEHAEELRQELEPRLDRLDNLLLEMQARADRFFDETVRLGRLLDLFNADKLRADFERDVIADVPRRLEEQAEQLIDWLVERDRRLWLWLGQEVQRRAEQEIGANRLAALAGPGLDDRRTVLTGLQRATREVIRRHDQPGEAARLANSVRDAVTRGALVEVGAVSLGAITMAIVGSAAADVTGLVAAGALAGLGFYLLPLRRRRAKREFRERTGQLRETLASALRGEIDGYLTDSLARARGALAPYDRYVDSEQARLAAEAERLEQLETELRVLRGRVGAGEGPPPTSDDLPTAAERRVG